MTRRVLPITLLLLGACEGRQSAFSPAGPEAERIDLLFWIMTAAGAAILLGVIALAALALRGGLAVRQILAAERFIVGAGLVFPAVTLAVLLLFALLLFATRDAGGEAGNENVFAEISGEQWWWRVTYRLPDGQQVASANELRIPTGQPVRLALTTADVLHSFWVPSLAGKLDMIPGRTTWLTLEASQPGVFRGQCAEYCGGAHALMAFHVVALEQSAFEDWLAAEARPAATPSAEVAAGAALFQEVGCGACHTVRGTAAAGIIGPDLTHVGGRLSLAAATLPNDMEAFARWLTDGQHIKPENRMPSYDLLDEAEIRALAHYLDSLE